MAKKIDFTRVNDFLFHHGEKIALGTCAALAFLLGGMALMHAMNAGTADGTNMPFAMVFRNKTREISTGMANAKPEPLPEATKEMMKTDYYNWVLLISKHNQRPYQQVPDIEQNLRTTPNPIPIRNGEKDFHFAYLRGVVLMHEYNKDTKVLMGLVADTDTDKGPADPKRPKMKEIDKARAGDAKYKHVGVPKRLVVVTARFPMAEQVKEFQQALRLASQKELLNGDKDDLPKPLGFNVYRMEMSADGKTPIDGAEAELLVGWDKSEGKVKIAPNLEKFLREAVYDEATPDKLESYIWEGLTMPMPKFAPGSARNPGIIFKGMETSVEPEADKTKPDAKGKDKIKLPPEKDKIKLPGKDKLNPKDIKKEIPQIVVVPDMKEEDIRLKDLRNSDPHLALRLADDKFNIYHVLGRKPKEAAAGDQPAGPPRGGIIPPNKVPGGDKAKANPEGRYFSAWDKRVVKAKKDADDDLPEPKIPGKAVETDWETDAIIRFIDVDVEPGKTYAYSIQVRLANPNFGKTKLVAFASLATFPELPPTPWVMTPSITIPPEYFLYAIDQQMVDDLAANKKLPQGLDAKTLKELKDHTTLQIHQWVERKPDPDNPGERMEIGDWAIAERQVVRKGDYIGRGVTVAVPAWRTLKDSFEVPLLPLTKEEKKDPSKVERKGGFKVDLGGAGEAPVLVDFTGGKKVRGNQVEEEMAVDALVLNPDGSLMVLNSRDALTDSQPDYPRGVWRQERVTISRARVQDTMYPRDGQTDKKGPAVFPKLPPKK